MAGGIIQLQDSPDESLKQECSSNDVLILAPEAKDEAAASHEQKQWIQLMMMKLNEYALIRFFHFVDYFDKCFDPLKWMCRRFREISTK